MNKSSKQSSKQAQESAKRPNKQPDKVLKLGLRQSGNTKHQGLSADTTMLTCTVVLMQIDAGADYT